MSRERAGRLAWAAYAVYVALVVATVVLVVVQDAPTDELVVIPLSGFATVGALIAARQPRNAVGWILLGIGLAFGLNALIEAYVARPSNPGRVPVAWLSIWWWRIWLVLAAILLPLVFPHGRLLSRRWRMAVWLAIAGLVLSIVGDALQAGPIDVKGGAALDNPLGVTGTLDGVRVAAELLGTVLVAVGFCLGAAAVALRFRRSHGRERQQLKWFAYVGVMATLALLGALIDPIAGEDTPEWVHWIAGICWFAALGLVLIGMPVATGIAILRHRLYDIDVVINRTLVYGALTATLAATYLGSVLLLQFVLQPLTADSSLAIAASTLAVAALFRPARSRIQALVDRRFY
ncbi:MAG: hypothetical protein M3O90_04855, partial [Actinomycetota bacterium]|nr:hypothetical protein [Actinomycetota bacterium]